jgi:hypothetical protein
MSEKQLRAMLAYASDFCERRFAEHGEIVPMWHAVTASGENIIQPRPPLDKDTAVAMIRALFEIRNVVRYVFFDEAWTLLKLVGPDEMARIDRDGLAIHPERVEVVVFQGEDAEWGQITAQRKIIRPAAGKPYLAPLELLEDLAHLPPDRGAIQSSGRMVGLLPVRGTKQ